MIGELQHESPTRTSIMRRAMIVIAFLACLLGAAIDLVGLDAWGTDVGSPGPIPSSGDSQQGEELYRASCIVCHGPGASGGIGPRLVNNPILSNDRAFWKIVYEGRHVMPPLKGAVTEKQMADIRAWLQTLR